MVYLEVSMKVLRYNAKYDKSNESFETWKKVNNVIQQNMTPEIKKRWLIDGYIGLNECALDYFGINRIYRDNNQSTVFEFTEHQWTMFVLRWL
jgi:hypothetical protein